MSDKLTTLINGIGKLLARCEQGIANCEAVEEALIERADEVEQVRMEDADRQRQMLRDESDPYKLRAIEDLHLGTLVDRDRARRVGRYERDQKLARDQRNERRGRPLIKAP